MREQEVDLVPFMAKKQSRRPSLGVIIAREGGVLGIRFRLQEDPASIDPAGAEGPGTRRDGLWLGTCFEAFVAVEGEPGYAEVNLAATRDWNVYLFDGYRCGMRPDLSVLDLPRSTEFADGILTASFSFPLTSLATSDRALEVGLAAVIRHADGSIGHWALAHPGDRPDFHRREGFLLRC